MRDDRCARTRDDRCAGTTAPLGRPWLNPLRSFSSKNLTGQADDGGQRADDRGQMTEIRGRKSEGRRQD